jgi:hypothetical protein
VSEVDGYDFDGKSMRDLIDFDAFDQVSILRGERGTLVIDPGHRRLIDDGTLGRAASHILTGPAELQHTQRCVQTVKAGWLCWHQVVPLLTEAGLHAWRERAAD